MTPAIFQAVADALLDYGLDEREALKLLTNIRHRLDKLENARMKEKIAYMEKDRHVPAHD